jgi:hypothetical protein
MQNTYVNHDLGLLVRVDFRNGFKERIRTWLEINHPDIFFNIDGYTYFNVVVTPDNITISGDEGLITLNTIDVTEI